MTATAVAPFAAESLLSTHVASLSRAAPYAIPTNGFDTEVIRLVSGAPAAEALPLADYAQVAASLLNDPVAGPEALGYGPHSGLPALREWIAGREGVSADRVLVTNGGLHGVSLAFAALLEPGDSIARRRSGLPGHHAESPNCTPRGCCRSRSAPTDWTSTRWPGDCVGSADQGALHGARTSTTHPVGCCRPRRRGPPGRTRRGVRIRHRLRQPLPRIRFRRPAGARTSPPSPTRWFGSAPSPRPSDRAFGSAGSSHRPGWCRTWRICGAGRTSIPRCSAND